MYSPLLAAEDLEKGLSGDYTIDYGQCQKRWFMGQKRAAKLLPFLLLLIVKAI